MPGGVASAMAMIDGPLWRIFWRMADALAYVLKLAWVHILDALVGPERETPADQRRERDRKRIAGAFPKIEP